MEVEVEVERRFSGRNARFSFHSHLHMILYV